MEWQASETDNPLESLVIGQGLIFNKKFEASFIGKSWTATGCAYLPHSVNIARRLKNKGTTLLLVRERHLNDPYAVGIYSALPSTRMTQGYEWVRVGWVPKIMTKKFTEEWPTNGLSDYPAILEATLDSNLPMEFIFTITGNARCLKV